MKNKSASTSLDMEVASRVSDLAEKEKRSDAWILREAIDRGLPILERELLGTEHKNGRKKAA